MPAANRLLPASCLHLDHALTANILLYMAIKLSYTCEAQKEEEATHPVQSVGVPLLLLPCRFRTLTAVCSTHSFFGRQIGWRLSP